MLVKVPYQTGHTNNAGPPSQGVYAILQLIDRGVELPCGNICHRYPYRRRQLGQNLVPP